jgi:ATP-dependent Clp protease ATP-binding subunit ClpB
MQKFIETEIGKMIIKGFVAPGQDIRIEVIDGELKMVVQ